jgi:hypothetical protein
MDPLGLRQKPIEDQLEVLSLRPDLLARLWPAERHVRTLVGAAMRLEQRFPDSDPRHRMAGEFLNHAFRLLRRPADIVHLCAALPAGEQAQLLDRFVMSRSADGDLVAELVADPETFATLPDGSWVGHALTRRVRILLEDHPDRRFDIGELIPIGIDKEPFTARAMLGAAFDEDRLTDASVDRLLEVFPGDAYLTPAIKRRRDGA